MAEAKKKKKVLLTPCPAYDIAGTEGWLEEMAAEGWLLCKDSIFGVWATFEARETGDARPVRYRLDAAGETTGWIFGSSRPDEEKAAAYQEMGWEYVTFHGEFYLYRSFDLEAAELHTDPEVQAIALKDVGRRMKTQLFSLIFWLVLYPLARLSGSFWMLVLALGSPFMAVFSLSFILSAGGNLRGILHLRQVKKRLKAGEAILSRPVSARKSRAYRAWWAADILLSAAWVIMAFQFAMADLDGRYTHPLAGYIDEIGVPTLMTMDADGEPVYENWTRDGEGAVEVHTDWLGSWYRTEESGAATLADGTVFSGGLYVDYIETRFDWMAEAAAREYARYDWWQNGLNVLWGISRQEALPLPDLGVDYAAAYTDIFPTVVLAEGNRMVRFYFYDVNETVDYIDLAEIYAKALKDGGEKGVG